MDKIEVGYLRHFQAGQTARLAPLTLLVGENLTGKTSFMDMVAIELENNEPDMPIFASIPVKHIYEDVYEDEEGLPQYILDFTWNDLVASGYAPHDVIEQVTEMAKQEPIPSDEAPKQVFLLQQPETGMHPRAQAALGSLLCYMASPQRQIIVETHSDHLMDRVRMDVRDKVSRLRPEDVSILFFEQGDDGVRIHSLRIDEQGNVLDAPEGYRAFFMDEVTRSFSPRRLQDETVAEVAE